MRRIQVSPIQARSKRKWKDRADKHIKIEISPIVAVNQESQSESVEGGQRGKLSIEKLCLAFL